MLKDWQIKFSKSFSRYPNLFTELDFEEQDTLSDLFDLLEKSGTEVLDDAVVSHLLDNSSYISELSYFITLMSHHQCLNRLMLNHLFSNHYLPDLKVSIHTLSQRLMLSKDTLFFLFSSRNPQACVQFILRALSKGVDIAIIKNFLSQQVALEGLNYTITLFDLSHFSYKTQHFQKFADLTWVLANPLCQTIFGARLRGFSDYSVITEVLNDTAADNIIKQVSLAQGENKVKIFFDFFTSFRPFPPSPKYIVEVNVSHWVTAALTHYCKATIAASTSPQDLLQTQKMIATLRKKGGDKVIFDKIKYEVASHIESEDLCSSRTYDDLMEEIWSALNQPQVHLETFTNDLHQAKGYAGFFDEGLRKQFSTQGMDGAQVHEKNLSL